jgi:hypothetical protein
MARGINLDEARALRGSGWDGDLDELRADRTTTSANHRSSDRSDDPGARGDDPPTEPDQSREGTIS